MLTLIETDSQSRVGPFSLWFWKKCIPILTKYFWLFSLDSHSTSIGVYPGTSVYFEDSRLLLTNALTKRIANE